jgi:lysophospholipase L1-like esterase
MHSRLRPVGLRPVGLRRVGLAALLSLGLLLAGCSSEATGDAAPAPTTASSATSDPSAGVGAGAGAGAGARARAAAKYSSYVALGDSYTAAPLVPSTDTGDGCLRSSHNYPALVAAALPSADFVDVSCSGADSTSLVGVQQTPSGAKPPQFDALSRRTDLVTIGIGGNDSNLFGTLVGTCSQLRERDPAGSPCRDRLTGGASDPIGTALRDIRAHVRAVVAGIRDRAPRATVVVVGYPQIVPPSGTCPELPLAAGDYAYARRINKGLADAVRLGARRADAYVDVFAASAGHDICSADPWINGAQTDPSRALAFHPFAAEQQAVARLVLKAL